MQKSEAGTRISLTVERLRKSFQLSSGDTLEVLKDVSFKAEAGEAIAIMGISGAGKSTLLHLLGGLESADGGSARFGGFEVTRANGARLAKYRNKHIGFVFQFHHLLPDLTARENVALPLLISRTGGRHANQRAIESLDSIGLRNRADQRIGDLSGGEQQRVALARAIVNRPRLLLADEPTGNLDATAGNEIGAQLIAYARQLPAIVIVATHNSDLAIHCDRTLVLDEGHISEKPWSKVAAPQSDQPETS